MFMVDYMCGIYAEVGAEQFTLRTFAKSGQLSKVLFWAIV